MELLDYYKKDDNTMLSTLKGKDLQEFLSLLNDYNIDYRDKLNLDEKDTFGIEIEYEKINYKKHKKLIDLEWQGEFLPWSFHTDSSLFNGAEVNSPILKDNENTWQELKRICNYLNTFSFIWVNSGGHIHVSATSLGEDLDIWVKFLKLWATYENVIFRFSYGEYVTPRPRIIRFATPIIYDIKDIITKEKIDSYVDPYAIIDSPLFSLAKDIAVNLDHIEDLKENKNGNTIEFRCPNGTLNPIVWQNNINLFMHLIMYSRSNNYDQDIVDKRRVSNYLKYFKNLSYVELVKLYNEIYLEQAIELSDLLFDNNLDKINYLKQYLKSFEVGTHNFEKSKSFSRSLKKGKY